MKKPAPNNKRDDILHAAYEVFGSYGFRRTSMDDIAKAAGVSRPALYQVFANKGEIFRGLFDAHLTHVETELSWLIGQGKSLETLLQEMLETAILEPHRLLEDMPHGKELLGVKSEIAPDLSLEWEKRIRSLFEEALRKHANIEPASANQLAGIISLAVSGLKSRELTAAGIERELGGIVAVATRAARSESI